MEAIEKHCKAHHEGRMDPECSLCRDFMRIIAELRRSAA